MATCPDATFRDPAAALPLATSAAKEVPKSANIRNTLGVVYYRLGRFQDCIRALEETMQLRNGGEPMDWLFLAMAHWQLGDKDAARKLFDRSVLQIKKNDPPPAELVRFRDEASELLGAKK